MFVYVNHQLQISLDSKSKIMKIFLKIIFSLLILLIFLSCENPNPRPDKLPPITTEGKGTFGYKVDGEVQGQCYDGLFTSLAKAEIVGDTTFLLVNSCDGYGINIVINDFNSSIKFYQLTNIRNYLSFYPPEKSFFISNKNDESSAVIELLKVDTVNYIISGTFSGTVFSEEGESVEITNGRFDKIIK